MGIGFLSYLDAKFALDSRSLNRDVLEALRWGLRGRAEVRCLDLGTGCGAMLRRVIDWRLAQRLALTGLDRDPEVLEGARERLAPCLGDRGRAVSLQLICGELAEFHPHPEGYDLITAHAFMDLVPLRLTLGRIKSWLRPGGFFYSTLNYDGSTHLLPVAQDPGFEARLLAQYDQSMEERRVDGEPTGGSRAGTRLHTALTELGFELHGCGSSDWNMTPVRGRYRDGDAVCLEAILEWIHGEGLVADLGQPGLDGWFSERLEQLRSGRLCLIVHQLDLLAGLP